MKKQLELPDITPVDQTHWDFKRILIGLGILVVLVIMGNYFFVTRGEKIIEKGRVEGISVKEGPSVSPSPELPTKEDAVRLLQEAQKNLGTITEENFTSSNAAIVKIIADLQALQGGKKSAGDVFCELVCKK